jgi:CTD small phosphatase-like protein 2
LLGRDLNRTIIVDNLAENFLLQPENGIAIKSWYDDYDDDALMQIAGLLIQIAKTNQPDVKIAIKKGRYD